MSSVGIIGSSRDIIRCVGDLILQSRSPISSYDLKYSSGLLYSVNAGINAAFISDNVLLFFSNFSMLGFGKNASFFCKDFLHFVMK